MFGYIRAHKPELKMCEYEVYKGVYCSLCKRLGKRYSPLAQLLLSYDFAFFALLKLSVQSDAVIFADGRCQYNPLIRCKKCTADPVGVLDICADAVVITAYYKIKDDWKDSGIKKRLRSLFVFPPVWCMFFKAKRRAPDICRIVGMAMEKQEKVETDPGTGIDAAAEPTAAAMALLVAYGEEETSVKLLLERLGYLLGRWVYIADAVDDCREDSRNNGFNPLKNEFRHAAEHTSPLLFRDRARDLLNMTAGEATAAFELLEIHRFKGLLENIVYEGLAVQMQAILAKYEEA